MLLGKYLKYALVGSALATVAAEEESKRKLGGRKLGNRKNRGYTSGKESTLSPTLEVSYGSEMLINRNNHRR